MANLTYTQAADEVRKILRGMRAVDMVADALENIGSLEAAAREAEKRVQTIRDEITQLMITLDGLKVDESAAKDEAKKIRADANAKARDIIAKAEDNAAVKQAQAEKFVADMKVMVEVAKAERETAIAETDRAKNELIDLNDKIKKAREQIANLLGQ